MQISNEPIYVTRTYLPDRRKYQNYIKQIFQARWLTNNGKFVRELEERLKKYLGVKNIILVANGTLALQIAYKALGLTGDVITTPFSFVATTSSLVWEGLNPVFADINPHTFCLDPGRIEKAVTAKTSAIVPVHVFGNACEVEEIQRIADKNRLKVIYDASHAFGVRYKGKSLLSYGDISTLSFHATKIFHTAEGGALVVNDERIYHKAREMADFGIIGQEKLEAIGGLGINAKMNELEAAMGICVLDEMKTIIAHRKKIFEHYCKHLKNELTLQACNRNSCKNYGYFPIIFKSENEMLKVKAKLNANKIYPRRYFHPSLDTLDYLRNPQPMPVSRLISSRILCLPIFEGLSRETQDKIIRVIKSSLKN